MKLEDNRLALVVIFCLVLTVNVSNGYVIPPRMQKSSPTFWRAESATIARQMASEDMPTPSTFREAEILGLRLMQEGKFQDALTGTLSCIVVGWP